MTIFNTPGVNGVSLSDDTTATTDAAMLYLSAMGLKTPDEYCAPATKWDCCQAHAYFKDNLLAKGDLIPPVESLAKPAYYIYYGIPDVSDLAKLVMAGLPSQNVHRVLTQALPYVIKTGTVYGPLFGYTTGQERTNVAFLATLSNMIEDERSTGKLEHAARIMGKPPVPPKWSN